ncbi:MAG: hypothetical protein AAGG56_13785 [Pseudomonadota bacterium]
MCRQGFAGFVLICGLALSLASTGFAHRAAHSEQDPRVLAFLAAGGSAEALCLTETDHAHVIGEDCDACRLIGAALLPGSCGFPSLLGHFAAMEPGFGPNSRRFSDDADFSRAIRAPPGPLLV